MRTSAALFALTLLGAPVAAQSPLSAIDWLESSQTPAPTPPLITAPADEPPVASSGNTPDVEVLPLDAPSAEATGLLPMSVTGLPRTLWSASEADVLVPLIGAVDPSVPALSALLLTLLLAEADAPRGSDGGAPMLAARLDRLIDEGAVDPALALVDRAGGDRSPDLFARWMDLALLTGDADAPCRALIAQPELSRDLPIRIYCDGRSGNWDHAATVLGTARALGQLDDRDTELLMRYLDPDLADEAAPIPVPARPTPLEFRLFEAVGEALPTQPLPRAFAATDLSGTSGWRAQILAAERLARRGALSENRLLGIYSDRRPAASGGVWDRVAALQALERALEGGRSDIVGPALQKAWPQMKSAGLLVPFSRLFGPQLAALNLDGRAGALAERAALLSPDYEPAARGVTATDALMRTVLAIASGSAPDPLPEPARLAAAAEAWNGADMPGALKALLDRGQLGEVILRAMSLFQSGAEGNHGDLTAALASFRAVGLEDTARRAAIQLLILDNEGALR